MWSAVAGELPAEERRQLVERTATDAPLAQAWRVAHELHQAQLDGAIGVRRSSSWWPAALMGIAATLIVAAGVRVLYFDRTPADVYRDSGGYVITSQLAHGCSVAARRVHPEVEARPAGLALPGSRDD